MKDIDERIVEMQFDNKQFESGVQTTIKSLDKLKKELNLDGASRSLSHLNDVGRSFSLEGISQGIEGISKKFSMLGIMGITTIQNLTNSAVNAGKRIVSALTVDPIKTGLSEYETKIGAIQTILTNTASKGTTLKDVTDVLNELNLYADKTIYNFAEMTRNIGTFTAAGVDLKQSATAIKGIANLAAGSGSTANQASTAMYQLSQALAAGSVKLMDWNSVVNAGMGGELFQNALKDTAKQMGVVVNASVPFRESLESGWITSKVLIKTLEKFASDDTLVKAATEVKTITQLYDTMKESVQSGWAQSWEYIIGDKEQSTKVLTSVSDAFNDISGASADARNEMLQFWNTHGGRDALIKGMTNALKGLLSIIKPIKDAFKEIFPPTTGSQLVDITKKFSNLLSTFKIGEETASNIKRTFKGLFAIIDIGKQAFLSLAIGINNVLKEIVPAGNGFLRLTASIGDSIVALNDAIKATNAFNVGRETIERLVKPIGDVVKAAIASVTSVISSFANVDLSGLDTFMERVKARFAPFSMLGDAVKAAFLNVVEGVKQVAPVFYRLAVIVGAGFKAIQDKLVAALDGFQFEAIYDLINGGIFTAILLSLKKFVDNLSGISKDGSGLLGSIVNIFDGIRGCLEAFQSNLKANTLLKIAGALAILTASVVALSLVDSTRLTGALTAISVMFVQLFASMGIFEKIMGSKGFNSMGKITRAMITLSAAVLLLSFAVRNMAELDWNGLSKGLVGVISLSGVMVGASYGLSRSSGKLIKSSVSLVIFSAAINVLAKAVAKLGELNVGELTKGLVGVGVLLTELSLFMSLSNFNKGGIGKGLGLIALATGIVILSQAVKKLSEIDVGGLAKGLISIGVVLAEFALFMKLTGDTKKAISIAISMTILGAAMIIFANAISKMGEMSWEQVGKGLLTMAGALAILIAALALLPKNIMGSALSLVVIAGSLTILSDVLVKMGAMSWDSVAKSLVTLAGALTVIVIAMNLMPGALAGATALLIIATSLSIIVPVLQNLGGMPLSEIGKALLSLAGVFVVIGAAAVVLGPLTPVILALSGAVALLGLGIAATGAGLLAFSAGLSALAISGTAGAAALVVIVTSVVGLIPLIIQKIGEGVILFAKSIGDGAVVIGKAIKDIIITMADVMVETTPVVIKSIMTLLTTLIKTFADNIPTMVDSGMKCILGFLQGISNNISKVVQTAIDVVIGFIDGIASKVDDVIQAGVDLILSFINGLAESIRINTPLMIEAMTNLMSAIVEAGIMYITSSIPSFLKIGQNVMDNGYIKGIREKISASVTAIKDVVNSCVAGIREKMSDFKNAGVDMINGLIDGIKSKINEAKEWAAELGRTMLKGTKKVLNINSPSKEYAKIGMYADQGLAIGLRKYSGLVNTAASSVGDRAISAVSNSITKIVDVINGGLDMTPTIKPVLDISNIKAGSNTISQLLNSEKRLNVAVSRTKAASINTTQSNQQPQSINTPKNEPSYNFVQNNYSPKPLSRLEIYRQTKNQFATVKR